MKRVAIILGSPYPENSSAHLRGVSSDVINYKRFLMSSSGGAWHESEIHTGIHIAKSKIDVIQRLCAGADIAFIVYSGHGFMHKGENYLNINTKEYLNVSKLTTTAKRQITIIDACRTDYPYEHFEGIGDPGIFFDYTRPDIARALYDIYVKRSSVGSFTMFSSSANQASQDMDGGGRFTISLLSEISNWSFNKAGICMNVQNAFNRTHQDLVSGYESQTPEAFYTGVAIPNLPIGISSNAYLARFGLPKARTRAVPQIQKNNSSPIGILFGLAAIGLGISYLSK